MSKNQISKVVILIILAITTTLSAQKLKSVGLNGAYVVPLQDVNSGFSIEARTDFGEVLKYVFLFPTAGFKQVKELVNELEFNKTYINFGAYFVGYINSKPRGLYGGVGIHYHIIQSEEAKQQYINSSPNTMSKTNTKLGLSFNLGYLLKLKKVSFYIEPGYTYIHGGFNTLEARLGFNYIFK